MRCSKSIIKKEFYIDKKSTLKNEEQKKKEPTLHPMELEMDK